MGSRVLDRLRSVHSRGDLRGGVQMKVSVLTEFVVEVSPQEDIHQTLDLAETVVTERVEYDSERIKDFRVVSSEVRKVQ